MADRVCELMPLWNWCVWSARGLKPPGERHPFRQGYTGRDKIVKFEGCYHGHSDSLLVKAGSGHADTLESPVHPAYLQHWLK